MVRPVLAAIALSLVAVPAASAEDLEVVRVLKLDGGVVPGFILEKRPDGLLLRSAEGDVFVPWTEIDEVEHVGTPAEPLPEVDLEGPPPDSAGGAPNDLVPSVDDLVPRDGAAWEAYQKTRIRLVDQQGRPIGPASLGYSLRDFGRNDDDRYHAIRGGEHLTIPEFVELSRSEELLLRYEKQLDKAQVKVDAGFGFLAVSGGLGAVGIPLAVGGGSAGDFNAILVAPGLIGWSVATLVIAASLHKSGFGRLAQLEDVDMERFIDRPDAWPHVQTHNATEREANAIPGGEAADKP